MIPFGQKNKNQSIPTTLCPEQEGIPVTGQNLPSGSGFFGWLSYLYKIISDRLPILVNGKIPVDASITSDYSVGEGNSDATTQRVVLAANQQNAIIETMGEMLDFGMPFISLNSRLSPDVLGSNVLTSPANALSLVTLSKDSLPYQVTGSASANNTNLFSIQTSAVNPYRCVYFEVSGTWSATLRLQCTFDINMYDIPVENISTGVVSTTITANGIYRVAIGYDLVRLRTTSYSSGTVNVRANFYKGDHVSNNVNVNNTSLTVVSFTQQTSASYTRPNNTTAYDDNDALANNTPTALTFSSLARINGGSGYLTKAWCAVNQASMTGSLRLHLFSGSSAPTAIADNNPFTLLASRNTNYLGYIDFTVFSTGGAGSDQFISWGRFSTNGTWLPFICHGNNNNLYGLVEVLSGFTPEASKAFTFYLATDNN